MRNFIGYWSFLFLFLFFCLLWIKNNDDKKKHRNDVDDGAFYGTLLIPIVAAAKIIDTQRSSLPSSKSNDSSMGMQAGFPCYGQLEIWIF
jgi:hypothetical protein